MDIQKNIASAFFERVSADIINIGDDPRKRIQLFEDLVLCGLIVREKLDANGNPRVSIRYSAITCIGINLDILKGAIKCREASDRVVLWLGHDGGYSVISALCAAIYK